MNSLVTVRVNRSLQILALFVVGLPSSLLWAEEVSVAGFDKIILVAPQAQVQVMPGNSATVKIQAQNNLSWSAKSEGRTLRLTGSSAPGSSRVGNPRVEVFIPAVNLDIHVGEGSVLAQKWTRPLLIDLQKGKATVKEARSPVTINVGQGQIQVQEQQGPLQLDLYKGELSLKTVQGPIEASGFQGQWNIEKASGPVRVELGQGNVEVADSSGALNFNVNKAGLVSRSHQGRIEGQTQEGNLHFQLLPETDVRVQSLTGRVTLESKSSGAQLALVSEAGEISGTKTLRPGKDRGSQILRGRLKGSGGGRVDVRSERGGIVVRE